MDDELTYNPDSRAATRPRMTTLQKAELLGHVPVFSEVSVEDLYRLAAVANEVEFAAGQTVYHKDDVGESLYLVVQGRIECGVEGSEPSAKAGPGEAVGLYSVLTREPRPSAARAAADTLALAVGAEDMFSLFSCNSEMMSSLMKYFMKKLGGLS